MTDLTTPNRNALAKHEKVIDRAARTFVETGEALRAIRDGDLFRAYGSFEAYLRQRWGMELRHAEHIMAASMVVAHIAEANNCSLPGNEAQVRHLTTVRDNSGQIDLGQAGELWQVAVHKATEAGGELPTAADVRDVVTAWKDAQKAAAATEPVAVDDDDEGEGEQPRERWAEHACPNCSGMEFDEDGDCVQCREPCGPGDDGDDGFQEDREQKAEKLVAASAKEALCSFVDAWRDKYDLDDSLASAMLGNVAAILLRDGEL